MSYRPRSLLLASCLAAIVGVSACGESDKNKAVSDMPAKSDTSASPPVESIPPVAELPVQNATNMPINAEPAPAESSEAPASAPSSTAVSEPQPTTPTADATDATAETPAAVSTPAAETAAAGQAPAIAANGMEVYKTFCQTCHMSGLNGSIKYGDKIRWGKVTAKGKEAVYKQALEGIRNMPPRGGFPNLTDAEVKAAVDYIVNGSGGWKG